MFNRLLEHIASAIKISGYNRAAYELSMLGYKQEARVCRQEVKMLKESH